MNIVKEEFMKVVLYLNSHIVVDLIVLVRELSNSSQVYFKLLKISKNCLLMFV